MCVREIASTAGLSSRTGCRKQRTDSSDSMVRSHAVSAGSVTPNNPMGAGISGTGGMRQGASEAAAAWFVCSGHIDLGQIDSDEHGSA
ncbi:hypothetical protein OK006_10185 [Actinobacteria bacterium OK006]|nr:hypothetical protein OK006_10185 [Actinobacteria bacterium OK006]